MRARLVILALSVFGCGDPPETPTSGPSLVPITLALNWVPEPEFGGYYEGLLSGIYKDAGFDVTILPGGPDAPTLELLATGQAQVAIAAGEELLVRRHKGIEAVAIWPALQLNPAGLMTHAEGPKTFEEIQGGRVAIGVGSALHSYLWRRFGWEGKVEAVPYGGAIGPFLADKSLIQQAYITSEPCLAEAQGVKVSFLRAADAGWNPYGAVVTVADPPPPWAADFARATQRAWESYMKDPVRANAEIARLNDLVSPSVLGCISAAQAPFVTGTDGLGMMTKARWDATASTLVELGLIPAGSSADGAWRLLHTDAPAAPPAN
ncbi:MAG: ABC transporter substrate-binding protein [Deltaproteobacteria bacterium]|nr:ABC transporter substrate-binding protein [Deltaproteobacteria bacterium]